MNFRDGERTKPWHRAPIQLPSVPVWAHEISVSVEEWENASWSLQNLISSQELSKANNYGKEQLKSSKIKCLTYCPQPAVPSQAGSRYCTWCEATAFYAPRCHPMFSSLSKGPGISCGSCKVWASQTHLRAILRHLAFWPAGMLLFL